MGWFFRPFENSFDVHVKYTHPPICLLYMAIDHNIFLSFPGPHPQDTRQLHLPVDPRKWLHDLTIPYHHTHVTLYFHSNQTLCAIFIHYWRRASWLRTRVLLFACVLLFKKAEKKNIWKKAINVTLFDNCHLHQNDIFKLRLSRNSNQEHNHAWEQSLLPFEAEPFWLGINVTLFGGQYD